MESVEITLDGNKHRARLTFQGVITLERQFKMGFVHLLASDRLGYEAYTAIIMLSVKEMEPEVNINKLTKQIEREAMQGEGYQTLDAICGRIVDASGIVPKKKDKVDLDEEGTPSPK